MIPINSAISAEFPNGKEYEIEFFADLIIINCDKYNYFDLYDIVNRCQLEKEKQAQFNEIYFEVLNILKSKKLIENENGYQGVFRLTSGGKIAKDKGGYFKYMEYLKMKELEKEENKNITNNTINIGGDNKGNVVQSSNLSKSPLTNNITANTKPQIQKNLIIKFWKLISENPLISGIVIAIVLYIVKIVFKIDLT